MQVLAQYQRWLTLFKDDEALVRELKSIASDPKEIEDRFYTELEFGTAGMRGVMGYGLNRMNIYNIRLATQGLADFINQSAAQAQRGVAIAYDSRNHSCEFAREAACVLVANGIRVFFFESLRPVPVLSFTVRHLKTFAGIVITASHNPKQYNGFKVYGQDGGQLPPAQAEKVLSCIRQSDYPLVKTLDFSDAVRNPLFSFIGKDVDDAYIYHVKNLCVQPELCRRVGKKLKIVYTPLNGAGNHPVRRILKEIGFENVTVVKEQEEPNGDFPTVGAAPNPENVTAFALARKLAEEIDADLIMATDPDSDRLGCLVRTGEDTYSVLSGNQIGCLLMQAVLSGKKNAGTLPENGAVIKSIVSTSLADAIAHSYGVACVPVFTGFKFIAEKIAQFEETGEKTFLFGFEESFGFLSGNFVRDKDAVIAAMLLAECAAAFYEKGMTLYQGLNEIYQKYGFYAEKSTSVVLSGKDGSLRIQKMMENLRARPPKTLAGRTLACVTDYLQPVPGFTLSNVLFYTLPNGDWVCVRPSGTEPKIKLYANAHASSMQEAEKNADTLLSALEMELK